MYFGTKFLYGDPILPILSKMDQDSLVCYWMTKLFTYTGYEERGGIPPVLHPRPRYQEDRVCLYPWE